MNNEQILLEGVEGVSPEIVAANLTANDIYTMLDEARKDEALRFAKFLFENNYTGDSYCFYDKDGEGVNENFVYEQFKKYDK